MNRTLTLELMRWKDLKPRKPLVLRGARQVGKTYILKTFGEAAFPRCHYFNFEEDERLVKVFEKNLRPERILTELQFHRDVSIDKGSDLIILDEIQRCPRALTSLKYFAEEMPETRLTFWNGFELELEDKPRRGAGDVFLLGFAERGDGDFGGHALIPPRSQTWKGQTLGVDG